MRDKCLALGQVWIAGPGLVLAVLIGVEDRARVWELELVKGLAGVRELERVLHWQVPVILLQGRASKVAPEPFFS